MSIIPINRHVAVASFVLPWVIRRRYGASLQKLEVVASFALSFLKIHLKKDPALRPTVQRIWQYPSFYYLLALLCLLYAVWFIFRYFKRLVDRGHGDETPLTGHPLKPLVFPCRTSHTRLFPKKHSFSYSYLFVGVPVDSEGSTNGIISADSKSSPLFDSKRERAWFSVESADYLNRGDSPSGLHGKLDDYLRSQVSPIRFAPYFRY